MIDYRKYSHIDDYDAYKRFCEKNFGNNCYQSKIDHIEWLESNKYHFINLAVLDSEIIGCFHGFKAPVKINNEKRAMIISFLNNNLGTNNIIEAKTYLEDSLKMVLHLIMSQPEYQLG